MILVGPSGRSTRCCHVNGGVPQYNAVAPCEETAARLGARYLSPGLSEKFTPKVGKTEIAPLTASSKRIAHSAIFRLQNANLLAAIRNREK